MKKILIATGNAHKIQEFKDILKYLNVEVELISPKDLGSYEEPIENGKTYEENSYIKAKFFYDKFHLPTIADDSGVEIDFYDGKPGIYSARFLGDMSYRDRNIYITNEMKGSENRGASFHCVITYIENDIVNYYKGTLYGKIANEPKGDEGFGYDPIFICNGFNSTNAQLGQDFKNHHSHRALALRKWAKDFEK